MVGPQFDATIEINKNIFMFLFISVDVINNIAYYTRSIIYIYILFDIEH